MQRETWGEIEGQKVELFSLDLGENYQAQITNFGGALVALYTPDRQGKFANVVLGYNSLEEYVKCTKSHGVIVGRHANRIEDAKFTLNGIDYKLVANNGRNHIHGGPRGFGKVCWQPEIIITEFGQGLRLSYFSPHGDEGYPGNLQVEVVYAPGSKKGSLRIDYQARSDSDTVVNLTNHAYFNLTARKENTILDHELELYADFFTAVNAEGLPTGEILKVDDTPLDFRIKTAMGARIDAQHEQIKAANGYDHNWIIRRNKAGLVFAAKVEDPISGRTLQVWTTKPGVQFYSGNFLDTPEHPRRSGFCLETQIFPNSLRFPHFPSAILPRGKLYKHSTIYDFSHVKY